MRHSTVLVTVAMVLAVLVAVPVAGLAVAGGQGGDQTTAERTSAVQTVNGTAPGEQLAGAVGVQGTELEAAIDQRAFGISVASAASEGAQAEVLGDQIADVEQRLAALEERKTELEARRAAGEITEGKYRAEMAKLVAATQAAHALVNQTATVASDLPATLLEQRGINVTAIEALRERAGRLTGPEVAEIAREIGGPDAGQAPGNSSVDVPATPGEESPGNGSANGSERGSSGDDRANAAYTDLETVAPAHRG